MQVRLQKYLADAGVGSRRACEKLIADGQVQVNKQVVTSQGVKIDPGQYVVTCEPAIYLRDEGFGVRLENTVLVTDTGQEDLIAGIRIEADEIVDLMRRRAT